MAYLGQHPNDLERRAVALEPVIAQVARRAVRSEELRLRRMSGSGATCFGLFGSDREAADAAQALASAGRRGGWPQRF